MMKLSQSVLLYTLVFTILACVAVYANLDAPQIAVSNDYYPRHGLLCSSASIQSTPKEFETQLSVTTILPREVSFKFTSVLWEWASELNYGVYTLENDYKSTFTRSIQSDGKTDSDVVICHKGNSYKGELSKINMAQFKVNYVVDDGEKLDQNTSVELFSDKRDMFQKAPQITIEKNTAPKIVMTLTGDIRLSSYDTLRIQIHQGTLSKGYDRVKINGETFTSTFDRFKQVIEIDLTSGKLPTITSDTITLVFPDGKLLNQNHNGFKVFIFSLYRNKDGDETYRGVGTTCKGCTATFYMLSIYIIAGASVVGLIVLCITIGCICRCSKKAKKNPYHLNDTGDYQQF